MKKIIVERIIALILILVAGAATYYFYREGEISFLPKQKKNSEIKTLAIEIPFTDKEYKLSYKDKANAVFDIAKFEKNENWIGEGEFDSSTFFKGESSLFLSSFNSQKATVSLKKSLDISEVLNFKFLVYLTTDPANIEEFNLIFTGGDLGYKFPIRDLSRGWNLLVLPKEKFFASAASSKNEGVIIELISRPKTRSIVNLDWLWAEKENDYLKDWNTASEKFLSLAKYEDTVGLLVTNLYGSIATLKKIGSAKNYTFQVKFTPLRTGSFGFFLRGNYKTGDGYYLMMDGVGASTWQISKYGLFDEKTQTLVLEKGDISNFKVEKRQSYWLKAEMKASRLIFYCSIDNKNFTKLGEIMDFSFSSGGVGMAVSGTNMVLVDDVQFFQ